MASASLCIDFGLRLQAQQDVFCQVNVHCLLAWSKYDVHDVAFYIIAESGFLHGNTPEVM